MTRSVDPTRGRGNGYGCRLAPGIFARHKGGGLVRAVRGEGVGACEGMRGCAMMALVHAAKLSRQARQTCTFKRQTAQLLPWNPKALVC